MQNAYTTRTLSINLEVNLFMNEFYSLAHVRFF